MQLTVLYLTTGSIPANPPVEIYWRKRWASNPRAPEDYRISSAVRYDHLDTLSHEKENYMVFIITSNSESVKFFCWVNLTYYRDSNAKEIDLLIEENSSIHPIEIKKSASPDYWEIRKFSLIDRTEFEHGMGGIVCMCNDVVPIY